MYKNVIILKKHSAALEATFDDRIVNFFFVIFFRSIETLKTVL